MNRAQLRRIWRSEQKREPSLTWTAYLKRYETVQRARDAIVNGPIVSNR